MSAPPFEGTVLLADYELHASKYAIVSISINSFNFNSNRIATIMLILPRIFYLVKLSSGLEWHSQF